LALCDFIMEKALPGRLTRLFALIAASSTGCSIVMAAPETRMCLTGKPP
jgi:hypothetical protein